MSQLALGNQNENKTPEFEVSARNDNTSSDDELMDFEREAYTEVDAVSNMYMIDASQREIKENNSTWVSYALNKRNNCPQDTRLISRHYVTMINGVQMWLLRKESIVIIKRKDAYIPVVRNPAYIGVYTFGDSRDNEHNIFYDEIVVEMDELKKALDNEVTEKYGVTGYEADFYVIQDFKEAVPYLDLSLYQCVKPGQYFELQIPEEPQYVALAKVERNIKGVLLVSYGKEKRWLHITDPYAHEIGWVRKQVTIYGQYAQQVVYVPGYESDIINAAMSNPVPSFVFRYNIVPLHKLRNGDLVAVTDPEHRSFLMAHVVETPGQSDHFFHLSSGENLLENANGYPSYFHINSPRIFSIRKVRRSGKQLRLPNDLTIRTNETDLEAYTRTYTNGGRLIGDYCGLHPEFMRHCLPGWSNKQKTPAFLYDSMRDHLQYIEVFRPTPGGGSQLTACFVAENRDHILTIKSSNENEPFYMHYNDKRIFHLGTSVDMQIAALHDLEVLEKYAREKSYEDERAFSKTREDGSAQ